MKILIRNDADDTTTFIEAGSAKEGLLKYEAVRVSTADLIDIACSMHEMRSDTVAYHEEVFAYANWKDHARRVLDDSYWDNTLDKITEIERIFALIKSFTTDEKKHD